MGVLGDRQPSRGISAAVAVGLLKKDDDASIPNGAAPPPRRVGASAARGGRIAPLLPVTTSSKEQASAVQGSARRRRRLAVCGVVTVTLLYLMHRYGGTALQRFQPEALRATFESRGPVGSVVLYVALFCTGEVLHLPGLLFVAVGVLVWGCVLRPAHVVVVIYTHYARTPSYFRWFLCGLQATHRLAPGGTYRALCVDHTLHAGPPSRWAKCVGRVAAAHVQAHHRYRIAWHYSTWGHRPDTHCPPCLQSAWMQHH